MLMTKFSLATAAFLRAVAQHPRAIAAVVQLVKQPGISRYRRQRRWSGSRRSRPRPAAQQLTPALCRCWWPTSATAQTTTSA
jgi:hypothetical protein